MPSSTFIQLAVNKASGTFLAASLSDSQRKSAPSNSLLTAIVLLQEGKSAGLSGAINGVADSYWGKNKGRSMEGKLVKFTKFLALAFIGIAVVLNINF